MGKVIRRVKLIKYSRATTGYGNDQRLLELETDEKTLRVPDRALTYTELRAKIETGTDVAINANIAIYELPILHRGNIERLEDRGPYYRSTRSNARAARGRFDYFPIRLLTFPVAIGDKTRLNTDGKREPIPNTSGLKYMQESDDNIKKFLMLVADFTKDSDFEILSIPSFSEDPDTIKRIYKWLVVERNSFGFEDIMPTLNLKMRPNDVNDLLDFFKNIDGANRKVNLIGFIYSRTLEKATQFFEVSRKLYELGFVSIVLGVERELHDLDDVSGLHLQPHVIGETVSVKKGHWFPESAGRPETLRRPLWESIRFFNSLSPNTEGVYTGMPEARFQDIIEDVRKLLPIDADRHIAILQEFRRRFVDRSGSDLDRSDKAIIEHVRHLTRLHEYISSHREFALLRSNLNNDQSKTYIASRPLLFDVLSVR